MKRLILAFSMLVGMGFTSCAGSQLSMQQMALETRQNFDLYRQVFVMLLDNTVLLPPTDKENILIWLDTWDKNITSKEVLLGLKPGS